jgi:uncharacterized protein GlcG (DUF336 family)
MGKEKDAMATRARSNGCILASLVACAALLAPAAAYSAQPKKCPVSHEKLVKALKESVQTSGGPGNGGLPVNEWAAVVDRDGTVCDVAFSGQKPADQWPGSRSIAIVKASTANNFSLDNYAISTANLWASTQPGSFLYGLAASSPPIGGDILTGDPAKYGSASDPSIGKRPGGVVVFGGGLALYDGRQVVGGLGASGNTSCADHNIAWRVRQKLGLGQVPNGPSEAHNDGIIYDIGADGKSASGWGHPQCGHNAPQVAVAIGAGMMAAQPSQPAQQSGESLPPQQKKTLPGFEK